MQTSFFSNPKLRGLDLSRLVAISRGVPRKFRGRRLIELAPTWAMLEASAKEYDRRYTAILAGLSPTAINDILGDDAVLLCWEGPGKRCHRHTVARWLERALNIEITEL